MLSKPANNKQLFKLNKVNIDELKGLISLLAVFKDASVLIQTGSRPALHMAYIAVNKLERYLTGNDVDENDESINIDHRHKGERQVLMKQTINHSFSLIRGGVFRKRLLQFWRTMLTFYEKHLAAGVLHPLYRRWAFVSTYSKTIAFSYIRQQIDEILGISNEEQILISELSRQKKRQIDGGTVR